MPDTSYNERHKKKYLIVGHGNKVSCVTLHDSIFYRPSVSTVTCKEPLHKSERFFC